MTYFMAKRKRNARRCRHSTTNFQKAHSPCRAKALGIPKSIYQDKIPLQNLLCRNRLVKPSHKEFNELQRHQHFIDAISIEPASLDTSLNSKICHDPCGLKNISAVPAVLSLYQSAWRNHQIQVMQVQAIQHFRELDTKTLED